MRILIMLSRLALYLASDFWGGCSSRFSRPYSFSEESEEFSCVCWTWATGLSSGRLSMFGAATGGAGNAPAAGVGAGKAGCGVAW